ncbi:hypothetical protein ACFXKC_54345 [Streptomyces sp. NPDC059340]|uniref:hypothetical protein n=1 Tax=Streptomyces sp. NPDC059340 TaxID=3346806 RepID=UPI003694C4E6
MSAPAATLGGGLAATLTVLADAPWPIIVFVTVVSCSQQLVGAWNSLLHGIYERRALRATEPADVLRYLSRTSSDRRENPLTSSPDDPTEPGEHG